ncbi:MAG: GPW/gp25 family protein [Propionibacteriaceae bacterium]
MSSTSAYGSDLIGAGWSFPTSISASGEVQLARGGAELDGAILMILSTRLGERVMRPDFGCRIWDYVFEPITARTLGMVEQAAREALSRWEPRIDVDTLRAEPGTGDGEVLLMITYQVRASNDHRNLVFPFYTIPREVAR